MPLLAPVMEAARTRGQDIKKTLQPAHLAAWRSLLSSWWRPLPGLGSLDGQSRSIHVAVDGTSHSVELSTGAHFVVAAAAALGGEPVGQRTGADMEVIPARYDAADAATARDLMMQLLEAGVASEAAGVLVQQRLAGRAILWLDGSIFGGIAHLTGKPRGMFDEFTPVASDDPQAGWQRTIERFNNLLALKTTLLTTAEENGLWLIGVAKTQRASFLFDALAATPGGLTRRRDERVADGELLAGLPPGWSCPVLLDSRHFPAAIPPHSPAAGALRRCPAIVSCYVRPNVADLPLRIDVPASALGLDERLLASAGELAARPSPPWLPEPELMVPVIEAVMASYGGIHAYNAPLYAVDRLVRLSRRDLETRYLPICARVIGVDPRLLAVDRGRRRFLIA